MPENTVYVGRPTKWGNPFKVGQMIWNAMTETMGLITPKTKKECIEQHRAYIEGGIKKSNTWMSKDIHELKGKDLACWCKEGESCHADVLLEIANQTQITIPEE